MATLFAHAALPLVAAPAFRWPAGLGKRVAIVAAVCACAPDLDMATFAFEIRPTEMIGHRGLTHSLPIAALVAILAGLVFFRQLRAGTREWWRVVAFLFAAVAAHDFLDMLTASDTGVALFAPFSAERFSSPWKLLPSCELGVNEYFDFWGVLTLVNELLYAIMPVAIFSMFAQARNAHPPRALSGRELLAPVIWLSVVVVVRTTMPEYFVAVRPRVIVAMGTGDVGDPNDIPRDRLPSQKLLTRFDELKSRGLFDVDLAPSNPTWSSSFFPAWFGAEGGRWTDSSTTLIWRTLFGFAAPTDVQARQWMTAAEAGDASAKQRIFTLAPTEKMDMALGELTFPATNQALARTHNGHPRYWNGRCNGVATAAMAQPEPFRVVDVIGVDGTHIFFHPNDTKALLAIAYYLPKELKTIGTVCETVSFDPGATCSMSPAVLSLALLNRIGIAKESFLVDALPTIAKQYYAVARARVSVVRGPYAPDSTPIDPALAKRVASLVDVTIDLTLSSTTLAYARANVKDAAFPDGSGYQRVGLVPVPMHYRATLALDASTEVLGGRWTGDPPNGPDDILIVAGGPSLLDNDKLTIADQIAWPFIRDLAQASVEDSPEMPTLDLRPKK